ncbi:RhoGAP domain protein [Aphelenchoides besseyi]|nr:RhoGAP domain protein [Aphelenchoides besseyi]KAI6194780.1 RhoGAP domain protein [Aphelenchoides besseyi]
MTVAAYGMVICGTDELQHKYRGRIEKVKFGVPISEAFSHDIPATLLVLLLKVNKEGPLKKDIWRAPGNQAQVRKLSHIMQHGRLVNISHISVYTAASVIKKFLSKLPGGIFGPENEQQLFQIMQNPDSEQQRQVFCRVICSLSVPSQHLLVLLFGTFRIISDSAETFNTRMGPDAIGISVAPSLFHTCIHDQRAKLEDVMRFKLASQVISKIIQGFGYTNLFPRECYEFYARITGRTLRVDEHWHFTFQYPSNAFSKPTVTTFSTMMSTITAAMAARSYSLDTLGAAGPVTPPQLRSTTSCIQRGGSLKFNTTTRQPLTSCANIAGPSTSGIKNPRSNFSTTDTVPPPLPLHQKSSLHQPYHRQVSGTWENTMAGTSSASTSAIQRRSSRPQAIISQAELLYAKRVLVSTDSPPHYPPPAPPTSHRTTIAARLTDLELHESNRTFSQPSICFATGEREEGNAGETEEEDPDQPGPSGFQSQVPASRSTAGAGSSVSTGAIERRRSSHADVVVTGSDDEEEQDVYSEALPGPLRTQARRPRGRASSSGMASGSALSGSGYSDLLAEQNRLSTSMGEVLIHEGRETTSESTRSLSYLEWVHEKQTRRMVSRSEWFLSPNKGASRSIDFHHEFDMKTRVSTSSPSPSPVRHLQLPTDDLEMRSSSEEMRSQSCASSQSHASSAKEQRPDLQLPPLTIVKPLVATTTTGETTPRLPFQLLQHHSGESDDAPLSATPPARSQQAPVFFPDDPAEPPAKTSKSSSSSSGNGNGSQSSVLVAPGGQSTAANTTAVGLTRVISGTSSSTPIRGPASASSTRRGSANGGGTVPSTEASRALIRRKSSGSSAQTKIPVQARRSTQI